MRLIRRQAPLRQVQVAAAKLQVYGNGGNCPEKVAARGGLHVTRPGPAESTTDCHAGFTSDSISPHVRIRFETSSNSQSQNVQSAGKCVGYRHHDGRHDRWDYRYLFTYSSCRSTICEVVAPPLIIGTVIALADGGCQGGENEHFLRAPMRLLPNINRLRTKMGTGEDLRPHAQWH